jgi:hypothetical protein
MQRVEQVGREVLLALDRIGSLGNQRAKGAGPCEGIGQGLSTGFLGEV